MAEALLCGMGVGVIYDLLRPFRHISGKPIQNLLDTLFCMLTFAAAFLFGQYTYKGRLGLWELMGLISGFGAYMRCLSPYFLSLSNGLMEVISMLCSSAKGLIKKTRDFLKLCFQKRQ